MTSAAEALSGRLQAGRWTIDSTWAGAAIVREEPFDALDLDLTLLWDEPPPAQRI